MSRDENSTDNGADEDRIGLSKELITETPVQRALVSLLFMVMPVDGESHPTEWDRLVRIVADDFDLDGETAKRLIENARVEAAGVDKIPVMTKALKAGLSRRDLLTFVSHMWEMVFADGRMHENEIIFIERVASLLDIPIADVSAVMTSGAGSSNNPES